MKSLWAASLILILVFSVFSFSVLAKKDSGGSNSGKPTGSDKPAKSDKPPSSDKPAKADNGNSKAKDPAPKQQSQDKSEGKNQDKPQSEDKKADNSKGKNQDKSESKFNKDILKPLGASREESKSKDKQDEKNQEKELKKQLGEKYDIKEEKKEELLGESKVKVKEKKDELKKKHKDNKGLLNALDHVKNENAITSVERNIIRVVNKETGREEVKTQITKKIRAEKDYGTMVIVEDIPKSMAADASKIHFAVQPEILEADPVVKWNFNNVPAGREVDVSYAVDGDVAAVSETVAGGDEPSFFGKIAIWFKKAFA